MENIDKIIVGVGNQSFLFEGSKITKISHPSQECPMFIIDFKGGAQLLTVNALIFIKGDDNIVTEDISRTNMREIDISNRKSDPPIINK